MCKLKSHTLTSVLKARVVLALLSLQSNNAEMKFGTVSQYSCTRFFARLSINQAPDRKKLTLTE